MTKRRAGRPTKFKHKTLLHCYVEEGVLTKIDKRRDAIAHIIGRQVSRGDVVTLLVGAVDGTD